jgi:hypothetical protein
LNVLVISSFKVSAYSSEPFMRYQGKPSCSTMNNQPSFLSRRSIDCDPAHVRPKFLLAPSCRPMCGLSRWIGG